MQSGDERLELAIELNDVDGIGRALEDGADIEGITVRGITPLMRAAELGDVEAVERLLAAGASVEASVPGKSGLLYDNDQVFAMLRRNADEAGVHESVEQLAQLFEVIAGGVEAAAAQWAIDASQAGDPRWLQELVEEADEPEEMRTPLLCAVASGDPDCLTPLLAAGAEINAAGPPPLGLAAMVGEPGMVARLLELGCDVDAPGPEGCTPLMLAAITGYTAVAELLLAAGADVTRCNHAGCDPVHEASWNGFRDILDLLAAAAPKEIATHARRRFKRSFASTWEDREQEYWREAILHRRPTVVRRGLATTLDPARPDPECGVTPLMLAAQVCDLRIASLLLDAGAPVDQQSADGESALSRVFGETTLPGQREAMIRRLVAAGADLEQPGPEGHTPLLEAIAAGMGDPVAIRVLLELGADPRACDESGRNAAELARQDPYKRHLADLIEAG